MILTPGGGIPRRVLLMPFFGGQLQAFCGLFLTVFMWIFPFFAGALDKRRFFDMMKVSTGYGRALLLFSKENKE